MVTREQIEDIAYEIGYDYKENEAWLDYCDSAASDPEVTEEQVKEELLGFRLQQTSPRYVILEKKNGDIFSDILDVNITRKDAILAYETSLDHLTTKEQEETVMELALLACENTASYGLIIADRFEGMPSEWETLECYTPIVTSEDN